MNSVYRVSVQICGLWVFFEANKNLHSTLSLTSILSYLDAFGLILFGSDTKMQRFNMDEQIASLDQQIIATQASIPLVVGEMEEVQKEIDIVQIKMMNATTTTTTTITNAAVTSEKQMDRWAEDIRQLAEDIEQLEDYKKQLHEREKQLRDERLAWMTYAASLAQTNKREFTAH